MCENEIIKLANKYKYKTEIISPDVFYIESDYDVWRVDFIPERKRPYVLRHKNRKYNLKEEHIQHDFRDLPWCFKSIMKHDEHKANRYFKIYKRQEDLLKNPPYIKLHKSSL